MDRKKREVSSSDIEKKAEDFLISYLNSEGGRKEFPIVLIGDEVIACRVMDYLLSEFNARGLKRSIFINQDVNGYKILLEHFFSTEIREHYSSYAL